MHLSWKLLIGIFAILIVLVVIYKMVSKLRSREGFEDAAAKITVTYFFLPECPYCKEFKPEWDKFKEAASKDASLKVVEVDASTNPAAASAKDVKGFPTVLITEDGGKDKEYAGPRTAADLMKAAKA